MPSRKDQGRACRRRLDQRCARAIGQPTPAVGSYLDTVVVTVEYQPEFDDRNAERPTSPLAVLLCLLPIVGGLTNLILSAISSAVVAAVAIYEAVWFARHPDGIQMTSRLR